jgi:hypothetical protein
MPRVLTAKHCITPMEHRDAVAADAAAAGAREPAEAVSVWFAASLLPLYQRS